MPADVTDSDASRRISERRVAAEEVVARAEAGGAVTAEELATVKDTLAAIRKENAKLRDELSENEEDLARQERIIKAGKGVADDLGGPIGLIVTALATGITTFIAAKKSAAKPVEEQKKELKETDDYADDLAARIDKLEGRLSERARLEAVSAGHPSPPIT